MKRHAPLLASKHAHVSMIADKQARVNNSVLDLLPEFILVLFLKYVQQAQCRSER